MKVSIVADLGKRFSYWRNELVGGISAGLAGLPIELNYGLIAVAPLGAAYAQWGIMAALHTAVVASIVAAMMGSRPAMVSGSRAGLMLILASLLGVLLADPTLFVDGRPDIPSALSLMLVSVLLAGGFQLLFGVFKLGRMITFVPQPVLAGVSAGIAFTLFMFALRTSLGLSPMGSYGDWIDHASMLRPWSILVMLASLGMMLSPPRRARGVPAVVTALLVGMLLNFAMVYFLGADQLSGNVAPVEGGAPTFRAGDIFNMLQQHNLWAQIPRILPYSMAMAVLASIETLMAAMTVDMLSGERYDSDRVLVAEGVSNVATACFGGTVSGVSSARVMANWQGGGRGRLSTFFYAMFILVLVALVPEWFSQVPKAVIGGMLMFFSWTMIDDWQRRVIGKTLFRRHDMSIQQWRSLATNTLIVGLVAMMAVVGNLMQAIAIGIAAALFLFVRGHAQGVIRGIYSGEVRHSLKVRNASEATYLMNFGSRIGIIEVEGTLFFGSADRVARELESLAQRADILILDLRRVIEVDSTGVHILQMVARRLNGRGKRLLLSHVIKRSQLQESLDAYSLQLVIPHADWFGDLDLALELAEDILLELHDGSTQDVLRLSVIDTELGAGLDDDGLHIVEESIVQRHFSAGEVIFCQGDSGDSLFVVARGSVGIRVPLDRGESRRIAAFGPGVMFGEMALIDGLPRSAEAVADIDADILELRRTVFERLLNAHPRVSGIILQNISRSLSQRLRSTTLELHAARER